MGLHTMFDRFDSTLRISFFSLAIGGWDSAREASSLYSWRCSSVNCLHLAEDTLFLSDRLANACASAKQGTKNICTDNLCTPIKLSSALA